jgi:ribulose-bisphosphate carboxylase large chain
VLAAAGPDIMLLLGMGAYEHPGGPEAGARSVHQAIEAVTAGQPLEAAVDSAPELAAALAHFGS